MACGEALVLFYFVSMWYSVQAEAQINLLAEAALLPKVGRGSKTS